MGSCQPAYGKLAAYSPRRGGRGAEVNINEEPAQYGIADLGAREVLAANLRALMAASDRYGSTLAVERRTAELGCKVGKSTVGRMTLAETPVNLDYLDVLAQVFGLDAWQMLVPGLSPVNPPVLRSIGETEEQLYRKMRDIAAQVARLAEPPAPNYGETNQKPPLPSKG